MTETLPALLSPRDHRHPLDPLTPEEIARAVAAVRADGRLGPRAGFWGAYLDEDAARAAAGLAGAAERRVTVAVMDHDAPAAWEVDVVLGGTASSGSGGDRCAAWRAVDHHRPGVTSEEARAAAQACRESPLFRAALALRGIHDVSLVMVDAESMGGFEPERYAGRRLTWGTVWHRVDEGDNGYARPVQGVVPIIDMHTMEVLEVEDHGVVPLSDEAGPLQPGGFGPERPGLRPLEIAQPEGPSFTVEGQHVTWQGWSFRIGFTHREGLVLHDLEFLGRSVLRRAACNEMYVPYLDPSSTQYRKNFFDWGEYGAGPLTNSLELGCDCLGLIRYFDAAYLAGSGEAVTIRNAICMHEEDASILWKHNDLRRGVSEVRRARRLVVSNFQTVANYDYGFYWSLYQDGRIELEVKLTGILSASGVEADEEVRYGRRVGQHVQVPTHQHYFGLRLDTAVDGPLNRFVEAHAESEPDTGLDPYGNDVRLVRTPVLREADAAMRADPSTARHWRIESATATNRYGEPTAYRLILQGTARPYGRPDSVMARRAPFVHQHVWATPYDPAEKFIGGQYPNHAEPGEDGVHVWQRANRSLDGVELVVWPVLGVHHYPRPEQWPVMPVESLRMVLEPDGFFDRNPAMDVPAPAAHGAPEACCATQAPVSTEAPARGGCGCHGKGQAC